MPIEIVTLDWLCQKDATFVTFLLIFMRLSLCCCISQVQFHYICVHVSVFICKVIYLIIMRNFVKFGGHKTEASGSRTNVIGILLAIFCVASQMEWHSWRQLNQAICCMPNYGFVVLSAPLPLLAFALLCSFSYY